MSCISNYPNVFKPIKLTNTVTLKNRVQFAPHVPALADMAYGVTEELIRYVGAQAKTGVGEVVLGESMVDLSRGNPFVGDLDIHNPNVAPGLIRLVDEVHRYGAKLAMELSHAGPLAPGGPNGELPLSVSEMPFPTQVATKEDLQEAIRHHVDCSLFAKKCGFDIVFIHCAHGGFLCNFLSPEVNRRADEYGGSLENRMRFPLELLKAVREAIGPNMGIEVRVSATEMIPTGITLDETVAFCKEAQKYASLIHVSNGTFGPQAMFGSPSYLMPHMINIEYSKAIKEAIDIPVAVVGNINSIEEAEHVISNGYADMVCMARALIAGPTMLRDAVNGEPEMTTPCIHCMDGCRGPYEISSLRCCVNPVAGREARYGKLQKADNKLKIMVIGGGPGGMQAARTAAERGHDVTLYESADSLGGRLKDATLLPFKEDLRKYMDWAIRTTKMSGAKIVCNTKVTAELIKAENPDHIIVATGSTDLHPGIKGIDGAHVHMLTDVDGKVVEVGGKVVVCGGGLSGVECGLQLARDGKDVTVVDIVPFEQFCGDMFPIIKASVFFYAQQAGVKFLPNSKVVEFNDKGVVIEDANGETQLLEADDAVIAFGRKSDNALYNELAAVNPFKVTAVGDCIKPANVFRATSTGFDAVVDL